MGTTTTLRVTSDGVDSRMLFLRARRAVGIPDEWPFEDEYGGTFHVVRSTPGGFAASVAAYWHDFEAIPWDDEDTGPPCFAEVWWDTSPSIDVQHDRYVAEVGAWLDTLGASHAACVNGEWLVDR